jgi:hypothetical protein
MIATTEVTLTLGLTAEGRLAFAVKTPDRYNAIELLGMLEAAKLHIYSEMEKP